MLTARGTTHGAQTCGKLTLFLKAYRWDTALIAKGVKAYGIEEIL